MEADSYSGAASPSETPTDEAPEEQGEGDDESKTGLLDSSLFPGDCKPGDKYTIEIVAVYGDSKEVKVLGAEEPDQGNQNETSMAKDRMGEYATEE